MAKERTSDPPSEEVFRLLQPELLPEDELRRILTDLCVSKNLYNFTKKDLVQLFRNVALPLPQREYTGTSWREKRLAKKQSRTKRTISISHDNTSTSKSEPSKKAARLSNDNSSPHPRLKPPPDLINRDKKVIKLSDSSSKSKDDLDKIVIKRKSTEKQESSSAQDKSSSNGKDVSPVTSKSSNVVKLKRDSIISKEKKEEETKNDEPSKKKRQKIVISW